LKIIKYPQMEQLLTNYKKIDGASASIQHEIQGCSTGFSESDFIEGISLGRSSLANTAVDTGTYVSDKTSSTALSYKYRMEQAKDDIYHELTKELAAINIVLDKLNIGLRALPEETRKIIELKYFEDLFWVDIERRLVRSVSSMQDMRRKGIKTLCSVSRITNKQYVETMRLLNL